MILVDGSDLGRDALQPAGSSHGVVGQLPLPCALRRRPPEALSLEFGSDVRVGFPIEDDLEAVLRGVHHDPAPVELPALRGALGPFLEFRDPATDAPDIGVVVLERVGRITDAPAKSGALSLAMSSGV